MIGILNYGVGNTASIANMFKRLQIPARVISNPAHIDQCTRLILPGIGAFDVGMTAIAQTGFLQPLHEAALVRRLPILGICLGAQLMTQSSEEGKLPGLGWFQAETRKFDFSALTPKLPLPNIGWRHVAPNVNNGTVPIALPDDARFYFVHNYHFHASKDEIWLESHYGFDFPCALAKGNLICTQFHPEKSHHFGFELLRGFSTFEGAIQA